MKKVQGNLIGKKLKWHKQLISQPLDDEIIRGMADIPLRLPNRSPLFGIA